MGWRVICDDFNEWFPTFHEAFTWMSLVGGGVIRSYGYIPDGH